jgi:hypothetical protein
MTRDELLADLRERVVRDGGPTGVTDPAAAEAAEQLLDHVVGPNGLDMEVLHTVGLWSCLRARALLEPERSDAALRGGVLLAPVFLEHPGALPDALRADLVARLGAEDPRDLVPEVVTDVAMVLLDRFQRTGSASAAAAAVSLSRAAAKAAPDAHRSRGPVLCNLGWALLQGELQPAELGDAPVPPTAADEVVDVFRSALACTALDHPNFVRCACGLALSLRSRALLTGDPAGHQEAAGLLRTALSVASSAPERSELLFHLGTVLYLSHEADPRPAWRDEATAVLCEAVLLLPERSTSLALRRGASLLATHRDHPERPGFAEAVDVLAAATAVAVEGTVEHSQAVMLFHLAQRLRADPGTPPAAPPETSDAAVPDETLAALTTLVARMIGLEPNDGTSRTAQTMDLAATVLRYQPGTPPVEVLDKLGRMLSQQVAHLPPEQRGAALELYLQALADDEPPPFADTAELDRVIALHERLLRELPPDHEQHDLVELGHLQLRATRHFHTSRPADAAEGIAALAPVLGEMMQKLPPLVARISARMDLDAAFIESSPMLGQSVSSFDVLPLVDQRRRRHRARLAALRSGDPDRARASRALVISSFEYYMVTADESAYREAVELMQQADAAGDAPDPQSVVRWGQAAYLRTEQLAAGAALPDDGRGGWAATASSRAVTLLRGGDARGALEALEQDRALLLSTAVAAGQDLRALRAAAPDLADEFAALRDAYLKGLDQDVNGSAAAQARFRGIAGTMAGVYARIRALPSLDRFAMPLSLGVADLAPAAAEGDIVVINVHPRRCDAVVLQADDVRAVPLPDLTADAVVERVHAFHRAVADRQQGQRAVLDTLGWLWDVLAGPVLDALGFTGPPAEGSAWPRLWWSPTGVLSFLPLHAAGHHDRNGAAVLDRVVSSYTPTIRSLLRSQASPPAGRRTALAVAVPETAGHAALPMTVREVTAIAEHLPGPAPLIGPGATRATVLAALPHAAIAHFACHAQGDPDDVTAGHLLLHDGPLSTAEISRLDLTGAELAYLSACGTARGVTALADEAFHPASAFQLAGYDQVVATLWEVRDATAARTAAAFYRELGGPKIGGPQEALRLTGALALHRVVRRMRKALPAYPAEWAAPVHIGA